jgi:O-antigen ligase
MNRMPALGRETAEVGVGDGLLGWIPAITIAYATILTPLLLQQNVAAVDEAAGAASVTQGSNFGNQIFWILMLMLTGYASRHRLTQLLDVLRKPLVVLIGIYMILAFASILWSPAPSVDFRRATLQFIVLATVVLPVFLAENRMAQIDRLVAVFLVTIAINLVAVLVLPTGRLGHQGIYSHKNELGLVVAYGFVFCLYAIVRYRGLVRILAFACACAALLELVLSQSKTSLGLAVMMPLIALAVVGASRLMRVNALLPLAFALFACVSGGLFVAHLIDFSFADFSMLLFDDTTFTGRTVIWNFLADVISREPLLGQGYGSFWDIGEGSIVQREAPGFVAYLLQGHNGYVDVTVELGLLGLAVLLAFLTCVLYNVGRAASGRGGDIALTWLFMICILIGLCHNMLESSWFRGYSVVWMVFLLVGAWAQAFSDDAVATRVKAR